MITFFFLINATLRYPYTAGMLHFPHDEGAHYADTVTSEWWYLNMDLVDDHGDSFGIMLTHFRKPAVARIFNVTTGDTFYSNVNILGSLSADTGHVYLIYRNLTGSVSDTNRWTYPEDSVAFSYLVKVNDTQLGISCSLRLRAFDFPFAIDSLGIVVLGDSSNLSYYYAIPFINVQGKLDIGGEHHNVHGNAWIDRQWGPFYVTPEGGYEWFSTVASQSNRWLGLQVWNLFDGDSVPRSPDFRHINIFVHGPDSSFQIYTSRFVLERLGYLYDPVSQKYFSKGWRILWNSNGRFIFLEMYPELDNQITTFLTSRFYEGITWISKVYAIFNGEIFISQATRGYGFAELVQKYDSNIIPPEPPQFIGFTRISNGIKAEWHPSVRGTYPVAGYRIYYLNPQNPDFIMAYTTVLDTFIIMPSVPYTAIMISAFDSASAVNGSSLAGPFIFTGISEETGETEVFRVSTCGNGAILKINSKSRWEIKIYSSNGRLVKRLAGIGNSSLNLKLNPGVYFAVYKGNIEKFERFIVIH